MTDPTARPRIPQTIDYVTLLGLGASWGSSFMFMKIAVGGMTPLMVVFGRLALAALCLGLVVWAVPKIRSTPGRFRHLLVIGIGNYALPFLLLSWALNHVASVVPAIFMGSIPLMLAALTQIFLREERFDRRGNMGLGVGFLGVLVLLAPDLMRHGFGASGLGLLACLGAAVSYAICGVYTRLYIPKSSLTTGAAAMGVGALVALPFMILTASGPLWRGDAESMVALIAMGVIGTAVPFGVFYVMLPVVGVTFVSIAGYLVPLFGAFYGVVLMGETLHMRYIAALALILVGLALTRRSR
ncbi:MAG: DMT family transporter [Magnetospiraceae bacterium]